MLLSRAKMLLSCAKMLLSRTAFLFCRGETPCEHVQDEASLVMETYYPFTRQTAVTRGHRRVETSAAEHVRVRHSALDSPGPLAQIQFLKKFEFDLRGKKEVDAAANVCPGSTATALAPPAASVAHVSAVSVAVAGKQKVGATLIKPSRCHVAAAALPPSLKRWSFPRGDPRRTATCDG